MATMTTVTVATGKELTVAKGGHLKKLTETQTASIPTADAVKLIAAGVVS